MRIAIEPEPEWVSVRGGLLRLNLAGRSLLRPGRYTVVAEKAGYRRLEHPIEVDEAENQSFSLTMERLPGLLSVSTDPVADATVWIDGEAIGATPLSEAEVKEGHHVLRVTSARYLPVSQEISIEGGGAQHQLAIELEPAWAEISFASEPPGAALWVEGEEIGATPLTAEILAGTRDVELRLSGYKTWKTELIVEASQPQSLEEVRLEEADGRLALRSNPVGASVAVDGTFRGQTPLELDLSPGQPHAIRLSKLGHRPVTRTIELASGEEQELRISLAVLRGEIDLVSEPADAELYIDGALRGSATQRLTLTAVPHAIEVRQEGYETYRTKVTPRPGFPQALRVKLLTPREAKLMALPKKVTTAQGQELGLVSPGHFTMGAPRREQGRRANEVLREVELARPFYIAEKEVTNGEFREFRNDHTSGMYEHHSLDADENPVAYVTWEDAARYCNWLSSRDSLSPAYVERGGRLVAVEPLTTGYRLPTEAEWAWVARYDGGNGERKYPWGASLPPSPKSGNYADASAKDFLSYVLSAYDDGYPVSAPAGSFAANPLGLFDLGGNVAEWTHDYYAIQGDPQQARLTDPTGPKEGKYHVIRGASWQHSSITQLRLSYRDYGNKKRPDLGFRIVRYAE